MIRNAGADNIAVILRGVLGAGDVIGEAGLSVWTRAPKPPLHLE